MISYVTISCVVVNFTLVNSKLCNQTVLLLSPHPTMRHSVNRLHSQQYRLPDSKGGLSIKESC